MSFKDIDEFKKSEFFSEASRPGSERQVLEEFDQTVENVSSIFSSLVEKVKILYEMIKNPDYKISSQTKILIVAALLYFVTPIDLVPDFIPIIGWADDAALITLIFAYLHKEIESYQDFVRGRSR